MSSVTAAIDPTVPPSGPGCVECLDSGGWWFHLRRCAQCGHVGCCDSSPNRHATAHFQSSAHPLIRSYEPGEDWWFCYLDERVFQRDGVGALRIGSTSDSDRVA